MSTSQMTVAQLDTVRADRIRQLEKELKYPVVALVDETQRAHLSENQMQRLQSMERELGVTLVAYESSSPLILAKVSTDQQKQLGALEKQTGMVLVAYELNRQTRTSSHLGSERDARPAKLSDKQFKRLQVVESEVGLTLMAYAAEK